ENTTLKAEATAKLQEMDSLNHVLDGYKGQTAQQDSIINSQQHDLEEKVSKIKNLLAANGLTAKKLKEATEQLEQYKASIAELQKKVEDLTAQNTQLNNQNQQLSTDLNAEKKTTASLSQDLAVKNKKVELGSLLHLSNLTVEAVKNKSNGKEVTVSKAKQAEK